MRSLTLKALAGGASALATLWLGGCATEGYVDKQVAGVQSQVSQVQAELQTTNQQVASNASKNSEQDSRIAQLDTDTKQAMARADESYKLAQGSFNTTQLAQETVYFKTGSAKLTKEDQGKLDDLATRLKAENKNVRLEIHGYTDSQGGPNYNERLGSERADAVFAYLGKQGLPLNKMQMMSHGEDNPAAPNDNADGRKQNRRTVVEVVGQG
jgi:peptidoglycan-associated lipoprotein